MSDNEGETVRLSRSWRTKDGVTIPAGTEIWVTEEQKRELREDGFLEKESVRGYGSVEPNGNSLSAGPNEPDDEFLDVHRDNPRGY